MFCVSWACTVNNGCHCKEECSCYTQNIWAYSHNEWDILSSEHLSLANMVKYGVKSICMYHVYIPISNRYNNHYQM